MAPIRNSGHIIQMPPVSTTGPLASGPAIDHVLVFVHGMGATLKGGTLQEWAQPLLQSFSDIALDHSPEGQESPELIIEFANTVKDHAQTCIRVRKAGLPNGYLSVLLTEARWEDDFTPTTAMTTYLWSVIMACKVWLRSLKLIGWNLFPMTLRAFVLTWPVMFALMIALTISSLIALVACLVLIGLLVTFSRVPVVGRWAGWLVTLFAEFLGDPAVWTRMPLQAAAMRQRVIETITEAREKFPEANITVVAHSQGAAIAGQVLLSGRVSVTNFISVGSGLTILGYGRWGGTAVDADPIAQWSRLPERLRWINMWGKFDFVPAGPAGSNEKMRKRTFRKIYGGGGRAAAGPEEHPIYNSSSLIFDHIVYSKNRVEVLDPIARLVYENEGPADASVSEPELWLKPVRDPVTDQNEKRRRRQHRLMVKCLGLGRILGILAAALLAPRIASLLHTWPIMADIARCDNADRRFMLGWICSDAPPTWAEADVWILVLITIAIAIVVIGLLNNFLWVKLHDRVQQRRNKSGDIVQASTTQLKLYLLGVAVTTIAAPLLPEILEPSLPTLVVQIYVAFAFFITIYSLFDRQVPPQPARPLIAR